jgi:aspartate-semialdehyde dehydrogenase
VRVAVVGATGVVGQELLKLLAERDFPVAALTLYASSRSAGKELVFRGRNCRVMALPETGALEADVVFVSAGSALSKARAWDWAGAGAVVIDNSSAWRMDARVPLVIPEINPEAALAHQGVIANPNCSTIIALMALFPLHQAARLTRATVATYQAVSGAGAAAMDELKEQTRAALDGRTLLPASFKHPIAFNLFSHDSELGPDGYNVEERKLALESRKILGLPALRVSATCVRVPVLRAHSEAIHAEFERPLSADEARDILDRAPGVKVVDDPAANHFPMPLEATGKDEVLVGRLREDLSLPGALALFAAGDQIRKGAALNAVQIAEHLIREGRLPGYASSHS